MPPTTADGVGEVLVYDLFVYAHTFKYLGGLVGLYGGDAHFGGDLDYTVEDGAVVIIDGGCGIFVQKVQRHQLLHALLGQVGVDGLGAVAQQGGKVVHVPGSALSSIRETAVRFLVRTR